MYMNHVYFLIQSVPQYGVGKVVAIIMNLKTREFFRRAPQMKNNCEVKIMDRWRLHRTYGRKPIVSETAGGCGINVSRDKLRTAESGG